MIKVTNLLLGVSDLDESQRFYGDALGLPIAREESELRIDWPDLRMVLIENPPAGRGKFRFGFRVASRADVDAWAEQLRQNDVRIVSGPAQFDAAYRLFFLDPDAYELEIYAD